MYSSEIYCLLKTWLKTFVGFPCCCENTGFFFCKVKKTLFFLLVMARTKQTAKKATGGKAPRKPVALNKKKTTKRPSKRPKKKISPKEKKPTETRKHAPFRIRRIRKNKSLPKFSSIFHNPKFPRHVNEWNRDYWRIPNMLGVRFQICVRIYFHEKTLYLACASIQFTINWRHKIEKFLCSNFYYIQKEIEEGTLTVQYVNSPAELDEIERRFGITECPEEEKARYTNFRRKHIK